MHLIPIQLSPLRFTRFQTTIVLPRLKCSIRTIIFPPCCRFFVDAVPVRAFRNNEAFGVPFPNNRGVGIFASLWDGSSWATQGGKVPLDWSAAPFVASFEGFGVDACEVGDDVSACSAGQGNWWDTEPYETLNANQIGQLHDVRSKYVVYDYCTDTSRGAAPVECATNWYE